ncbi:helix-turn-helix domain-containing protein [Agitococcus lubricus]|uniref:PIF1-like helicase n=1 Tax=Agitococcus lubricus TaxID=1077255 RepID=A0A2T5IYC9_9GAMM|nr:helix-turn-helix domain-containing protein [Agitococcus lubricus]PTQ88996.1 PIF1-like helicase [Agitococcus lubricus]
MKQATALNILKAGHNVFLTGSAGAGKTYTLNQYIHYLRARQVTVAITASTGIAATHMNGMTIHAWSGIGIKDQLDDDDLAHMFDRKYLRSQIDDAQVLVIDEVSMLHGKQLDMVNQVLKYFKQNDEPFGGLQLIVAGDFFQLPPVSKTNEANRDKFAFMSAAWQEAKFKICYLTEQHRQQNNQLNQILNEIRAQAVSQHSIEQLLATRQHTLESDITRLFTHNQDVEQINQRHFGSIAGDAQLFVAERKGNEKLVQTLVSNVRAPEQLSLKIGAKVMFVKNNMENGYINGTLGEVVAFERDINDRLLPKVKLRDGSYRLVAPETWSIDNDQAKSLASYSQIPLCLAWAITVHKSQGMTLEAAEIDLRQTFEQGQGYVALSRLKSLEGLRLLGLNDMALQLDRLAFKADQRFQALSQEAESVWATRDGRHEHEQFIRRCGGSLNEKEIEKYEKRLRKQQKSTTDAHTVEQTKVLFAQGLSLVEIAKERELMQTTIINHLEKIMAQDPSFDLSRIKPADTVLEAVKKVYQQVLADDKDEHFNNDGSLKLRPLFEALQQKIGYNDIKLALLFVEV